MEGTRGDRNDVGVVSAGDDHIASNGTSKRLAPALVIDDPPLRVPSDVFTLQGFLQWVHSEEFPEDRRASYLAGEVYLDMSAEELVTHNLTKSHMTRDLGIWLLDHDLGILFADGALVVNEGAGLSNVPDLTFCHYESLRTGRVRLIERVDGSGRYTQLSGSPDLTVEIVSDTSVTKDTELLPGLYFAAGVKEYWLIDARGRGILFRLFRRGRKRFVEQEPDSGGYRKSKVLGGQFRLTRKKNAVGTMVYRLLGKE